MARLAQAPHRPHPAEHLLDALADPQTTRVADMARGAAINSRAAPFGVLREVRRHAKTAHLGDEVLRVVAFVRAQGDAPV